MHQSKTPFIDNLLAGRKFGPVQKVLWLALLALASVNGRSADQLADFHLRDANTASVRGGQTVSPRDYIYQVTGVYFGDAG